MASGLGFDDLMNMAESNALKGEKKIKNSTAPQFNLTTKPKKISSRDRQLSEGVKKFLQKREEEEKMKAKEDKLKKEKLMQLRYQDKKAHRRVNSMLTMTKSANKACMADAKHCLNDSLAEQGDFQPDEDDYGYESQHSQAMYQKLMDKYKQQPVSKPQMGAKRVPVPTAQTLAKYKNNHKHDDGNYEESYAEKSPEVRQPQGANPKKSKKPPEILNFQAMLELANKKAQEPLPVGISMKPKLPKSKEEETYEFGRPMTAKEKARFLQEKALKEKLLTLNGSLANEKQDIICKPPSSKFKIPSLKKKEPQANSEPTGVTKPPKAPNHSANAGRGVSQNIPPKATLPQRPPPAPHSPHPSKRPAPNPHGQPGPRSAPHPPPAPAPTPARRPPGSQPIPDRSRSMKRPDFPVEAKPRSSPKADFPARPPDRSKSLDKPGRPSESRPPAAVRPSLPKPENRALPSRDVDRQRQRSPARQEVRRPNPAAQQRAPPQKSKRPLPNPYADRPPASRFPVKQKRLRIDSDEEEDSEMDDFIDDDDVDIDVSSEIRNIFGYDKRRYVDMDDDDIEESSVTQQWKEEAISARIGRKEDLEDMKAEEEEKKRKMMAKKRMKR